MHAAPPFDLAPIPFVGTVHRAQVYRVHDGDTLWPIVDVGFGSAFSNPEKGIRLVGPNAKGFNTPELNATDPATRQAALAARDRVLQFVLDKFVYVESWPPTTDDKYGRWLMAVYVPLLGVGEFVSAPPAKAFRLPIALPALAVSVFDLASQLVAENLGEWKDFG
jgi:endonuclease YncB( thermonuclease family)